MQKKSKLLWLGLLPLAVGAIVPSAVVLSSCSSSSSSNSEYNTEKFLQNANKMFIDLPGMETTEIVKKMFASTSGMEMFLDNLANSKIFEWFAYNQNKPIISKYQSAIKSSANGLQSAAKNKSNADVQLLLNPKGGNPLSYVYSDSIDGLKTQFIDYVFANFDNSLCYVDSDAEDALPQQIKPATASNELIPIFSDPAYVNAPSPGLQNRFRINYEAVSVNNLSKALTNFVNYVFDQWIKEELPILTPSVLYKNSANGDHSTVFQESFFTNATIGTEGSYKFQFFSPAVLSSTSDNKTPGNLYHMFINQQKSFINDSLKGAISISNDYTEDESTVLFSNVYKSYNSYVVPYASAVNYKFATLIFGNDSLDSNVPVSDSLQPTIMDNFIDKSPIGSAPAGVFQFPWFPNNATGSQLPFTGAYEGMTGIKETVNISNSPWIITRDEFGVHIIGIDRFIALKEAASAGGSNIDKLNKVAQEIKNTLLYRAAEEKYNNTNTLDISTKLKSYLNDNFSRLILSYIIDNPNPSENNLFGYVYSSSQNDPQKNGFLSQQITLSLSESSLVQSIIHLLSIINFKDIADIVDNKIYELQKPYTSNSTPADWKTFGITGVLPYTRNQTNGSFSSLLKNLELYTNGSTLQNLFNTAKTKYSSALKTYLSTLQPASKENYFNNSLGKLKFNDFFPDFEYSLKPIDTVTRYVYTNNFIVNNMLTTETSTNEQYELFLNIQYDNFTKIKKGGSDVSFFDFSKMELNNAAANGDSIPTVTPDSFTNPNSNDTLTAWINYYLNQSIQEEFMVKNYLDNIYTSPWTKYGDWTTSNITTIAKDYYINKSTSNMLEVGNSNLTLVDNDLSNFKDFLKSLYWLLDYDPELQTYTFSNFIPILKDMVNNDENKVAYIGWRVDSNYNILSMLNQKSTFGANAAIDKNEIITRDFVDNSYNKFPKSLFLNNINPYSYQGAPNPWGNYTHDINNVTGYAADIMQNYIGNLSDIYSYAPTTNNSLVSGFLGFQTSSSEYISNNLPSSLFNKNQLILGHNIYNPSDNYRGILYQFNTDNNAQNAVTNFKDIVNSIDSKFTLGDIANKLLQLELGFTEEQKAILESIWYQRKAQNCNIGDDAYWSNLDNMKKHLCEIIDVIPIQAFERLDGDLLWNIDSSYIKEATTVFKNGNTLNEYVVSQFNYSDVENLFIENSDNTKSILKPNADGTLLGLQPLTFFKALVKLAMNSNIFNNASKYFNTKMDENPVYVYQTPLANKMEKDWLKNPKDF